MKKERFYYGADLQMVPLTGLITNDGTLVGISTPSKSPNKKLGKIDRVTICGIWDDEENTMTFGVSKCSSKDKFVKSIGRNISKRRAIESPFKVIKIASKDSISENFLNTAREIEEEVLRMVYPIKLY